ncbi:hypothetical protein KP509_01G020900 [Ceratopteris richardii]|uniref:Patatin n=1 Tax=Ceratopteris richardii TaxID=49495 RepID=A0A8T2VF42_CERRI|nr:hypothetical protein KP509_01G020900 [Ceratopteris richardii]KAH7445698.1 hypothetical protein KP509_01G020900 [Ceratopteris richardii]
MASPDKAHWGVTHRKIKLVNGEALAALEQGWIQYKEELGLRKKHRNSQAKMRLDFHHLSLGESPLSVSPLSGRHEGMWGSKKACILSIDGGGAGGIVPGKVLCYLEEALQKKSGDPNARIADFFDIVAGTSVGGFVATMLCANDGTGRPMFSALEACNLISSACEEDTSTEERQPLGKKLQCLLYRRRRRYRQPQRHSGATGCTKGVGDFLRRKLVRGGRNLTLRDTVCPILIPCYDLSSAGAFLFSRADAMRCESFDFRLADVCLATAALPGSAEPVRLLSVDGKTCVVGIDGGLVMNNPTAAAITHVLHNSEEFPHVRDIAHTFVLSIGTGVGDYTGLAYEEVKGWDSSQWLQPFANIVLDGLSDMVDHLTSVAFHDHHNNYVRIQVSGASTGRLQAAGGGADVEKVAEGILDQPYMEHIPFGGRRQMPVSNRQKLDWFADCLIAEQRVRWQSREAPDDDRSPTCSDPLVSPA